jgi:hypothetical protein
VHAVWLGPREFRCANRRLPFATAPGVSERLKQAHRCNSLSVDAFAEIPSCADDKRFSAGWSEFDQYLMIVPPQLMVVTGKPNHGKTEWVTLGMCVNLARLHAILQFEDNPDRNRRAAHLRSSSLGPISQQNLRQNIPLEGKLSG